MSRFRRMLMMASMGEPVPPTPVLPYDAEVEYLQSSGTQYIDTGIAFNGLWNLKCSCQNTNKASSARDRRYFGGFDGWLDNGVGWAENAFLYMDTHPTVRTYNNINRGYLSLVGNSVSITGNATYSGSVTRVDSTSSVSLTLFAEKRPTFVGSYLTGRIYYFSMGTNTDANNIIDLIPVRKDGIGYMYDKVSGNLLGNAGTGAFTYGNDIIT